jgi:MFS superfamily sulfate permease-like transporter
VVVCAVRNGGIRPEAISFSVLAGVDPKIGLFASFTMAVTIAFCGGRSELLGTPGDESDRGDGVG